MTTVFPVKNKTVLLLVLTQYLRVLFLVFLVSSAVGCSQQDALEPLAANAVILAFGDSLTFGTGAEPSKSYPAQLQRLISRTVINAGVPGEVSERGLRRLPELLEKHRPDLLILCHGGNDILQRMNLVRTKENLQQMIDIAKAQGTQILLVGVPQFGLFLSAAPLYQQLADENVVPLDNEVLSDILGTANLKSDRVHPNGKGYQLLAVRLQTFLLDSGAL